MSSKPPRGVPIPPRSRQDRRDSGVTAAVWGRDLSVRPQNPHGASLSLRGPGRTGGTRVEPPLCGGGTSPCAPETPTGHPYPSAAQAGPEGLGCNRRCVGEGVLRVSSKPPRGVPIPPRSRQDRRDSGVTAAVWGRDLSVRPQSPMGRPYPSAAQAGPEGLGCNRRCVGEGPRRAPPIPHGTSLSLRGPSRTGGTRVEPPLCGGGTSPCAPNPPWDVPIPPRPRQDRRDSGVTAAVWGREPFVRTQNPHTASLSLRGPGRTGGARVYPPLCGGGFPPTPTGQPRLRASLVGPGGTGCHRPRGLSGGRGNYLFCTATETRPLWGSPGAVKAWGLGGGG